MTSRKDIPRIGWPVPRADASDKVSGRERYAADYYGRDFVWAGVKRAGVPHARLLNIHLEDARKLKGIVAVLTCRDVPGSNRQGIIYKDHPVLVDSKIRYCGDAVALVVAESKEVLNEALSLITFDFEALPGVFDPEEALKEDAPKVHEDNPEGNILRAVSIQVGKTETAFVECDAIVEGVFDLPYQEHAYLETETGWAYVEEDGTLVIVASTQTPFRDRLEVGPALGLDPERIRVIAPYLGGAFGGKDGVTVQSFLGLAALHANGKPVKMWWDREESFLAGVKRLPARLYYRFGAKHDGTFHALECRLYFNAGAYSSLCGEIMTLAVEHAGGAYRIPNTSIKGWCVYTNNPVGGPFRGFGVPQVTAAIEQMVDMLAEKLGIDRLKIRLQNALRRGDKNGIGITLTHSTGAVECLELLSRHPLYTYVEGWKRSAGPFKRRGVGIACLSHAMGYPAVVPDYANAKVELTRAGKILICVGVVDMGQGNASTCLQIVGDLLNQSVSEMQLILPDTQKTLPSGSASASRCTYTYGNALIGAAEELRRRILEEACSHFAGRRTDEFVLVPGRVRHVPTEREISLAEIASLFNNAERISINKFTAPVAKEGLHTIYLGPHIIFSYGAHLACIEMDELTGEIEVKKYLAVTDAGKVLNPQVYEQQIQGGIAQGLGYVLNEDFIVEKGQGLTPDLSTYIIPTALDMPEMVSIPVEIEEQTGPFGLKGVGEVSINGPLPAVSNGVVDACGIRIFRYPLTAERVLTALEEARRS